MAARATLDPSRQLDLFLRINRDGTKRLNFLNSGASAYTLSGRTFVLNFKRHSGDPTNFLQLTSGNGLTINTSSIDIALTKAQAANFREQSYFWELVMTKDGLEKNWLTGNAWFHNGKFDGVGNEGDQLSIYDSGEVINLIITESGGNASGGSEWYRGDYNPSGNAFPTTGSGSGGSILAGDTYLMTTGVDVGPGIVIGTLDGVEVYDGTRIVSRVNGGGSTRVSWIFDFGGVIYYGGITPPETLTADSDLVTADNDIITADNG